MAQRQYFKNKLFSISSEEAFRELCLELFRYQAENAAVYSAYLDALGVDPAAVKEVGQIPCLPISFFKTHKVYSGAEEPEKTFTSSGTTGSTPSKHRVADLDLYEQSFTRAFERIYGPVSEYCIVALLPSYLEREGSSLIFMADRMIALSEDPDSGFYLDEYQKLHGLLTRKIADGQKVLLLGVTFALLEFAEKYFFPENDVIIMETGGMKGRRREMIRSEVHQELTTALGAKSIHSEYGMTELLSQAYSQGGGRFVTPPWMKVFIRQTDDPFSPEREGKTGGINIIDLANIDSCAFIETMDLGRIYPDASFEVMGRFDNSDIRGCNLMVV